MSFLVLGHFYAVLLVAAFNKVFFIVYTPIIHLLGEAKLDEYIVIQNFLQLSLDRAAFMW